MQFSVGELFDILLAGEVTLTYKPWGSERTVATEHFLLKLIDVHAGERTSLQHHVRKYEIHWIMGGDGTIEGTPDDDLFRPRPSGAYPVYPGTVHRAVGPLTILEISTNHPDDVVRHEDDYGRSATDGGE
jgi:mannose-6-phosphate isomerase